MKAKMKLKGPMELEFEITGTQNDAQEWLIKARNFLDTIPTDKISLKVELKEIIVTEETKRPQMPDTNMSVHASNFQKYCSKGHYDYNEGH